MRLNQPEQAAPLIGDRYRKIWVVADSNTSHSRRSWPGPGDKLRLLLRTLRENRSLARMVKEIHVPGWLRLYEFANVEERNEIVEDLSAIVIACTNLERLVGFYTVYNHELDSLTQALSSRTRLRERLWIIRDDRAVLRRRQSQQLGDDQYEEDAYEKPDYADSFLQRHVNWASLETLVLFGHDVRTGMDYRAFVGTFRKLQCLKNLSIAAFAADEFNDRTLQAIPGVRSLRLQSLPGVTDRGLTKFLNSESATALRGLTLINIEITSLMVLAKIFSRCERLRKFTFSQDASPSLPPGAILPQQFLASKTLEYLHWDPLMPGSASRDLASCIDAGAFPALCKIRAPTDYSGKFQELCRPLAQVTHDSDTHLVNLLNARPASDTHYTRNLSEARRAAQERVEAARAKPSMKIIVEEDGVVQQVYTMRSYMGQLNSQIEYSLEPDAEGSNDAILGLGHLISAKREDGMEAMCTGPVNEREVEGKRVWSHRPKRKGRGLEMQQLF